MQNETASCRYCGDTHPKGLICPLISAMEFYESQMLKRVEFFEQKRCQHQNRHEMSVSGLEHWRCKDCGYEHEKELS